MSGQGDGDEQLPRFLVIHHAADGSRETLALVALVRALVATGQVRVDVLLLAGGPTVGEFEQEAPTIVVTALESRSRAAVIERLCFALRLRAAGYRRRARRLGLDAWHPGDAAYLHSVLSVQALRYLPDDLPVVLCRLAEDVHPLDHPLVAHDVALLVRRADLFFAVAEDGVRELVDDRGIDPDRVRRVPELFVPLRERFGDPTGERERRRVELGVAPEAFVVGSFGTSPVDGPDLGVLLWSMLSRRADGRAIELLWESKTDADFWMQHDLRETGFGDGTHPVEVTDGLRLYLQVCDVVVLLTRVADFPFAYLERVAYGEPVVCFEGSGVAELVRASDPRLVAPYLDMVTVAGEVARILDSGHTGASSEAMLEATATVYGPDAMGRRLLDAVSGSGRP